MFAKVKRFFKRSMVKMIRHREERAARELARYLIRENRDFLNVNEVSLTKAIASRKTIKMEQISAL